MKRVSVTLLLVSLSCGVFMISFTACSLNSAGIQLGERVPIVKSGPPRHAPAHGYRAKYAYYYYPDAYVYWDISREIYFYLEGDTWRMSVSLPDSLRLSLGDHVAIEMDSDKPYIYFDSHKKKYPPGQLKKKWTKKTKS